MSVAKNIEITSGSPESFEKAITNGLERAAKTTKNIQRAWVKDMYVQTDDAKITDYRVHLILTFLLDE